MHLQMTRPFSGVVALLTGKRFLAGMWEHVILHTTVVTARIVALFTNKGLFSSVSELVSLQILRLSGGIVTLLTTERFLSWMDSHANHIIMFCSNQGSPSFSKLSKSADILKFCLAPQERNSAPSIPDTPYKRRHCDRCGKCFTKNTFLKMHKFRRSAGAKPFLQEKLGVLREIVSKTNFPDDSHVLLTQEKRLTNSGLWYLWKIFYEKHCHDDAQISPQWGKTIFRRRIEFCGKLFPKPIS